MRLVSVLMLILLTGCISEQAYVADSKEATYTESHSIKINEDGFKPALLEVRVGDIIVFRNNISSEAFIIGTDECEDMKSGILGYNDKYEYIFNEQKTCKYIDGINKNMGKIVVR